MSRFQKIRDIFDEAVSLAEDQRVEYLRAACEGDEALHQELESLLSRTPDTGALPVSPLFDEPAHAQPSITGYRILDKIGSGGMGIVYAAEQDLTNRRVAIKTVRGDGDDSALRARMFEREIQTLALLDHPGIATIFEALQSTDGQLCFAMELVDGKPLDTFKAELYASEKSAAERRNVLLRLFSQLCGAVQYAHQRGVIHRDLKPSNILVGGSPNQQATSPTIKVLDFGLARIVGDEATRATLTEVGSVRGTLRYMSPEQAGGDPKLVDARADVYSLGVILYQLLTDRLPHDLDGKSMMEALRTVCEVPPTPPSTHVSNLDLDLQIIMLKALARSPEDRYQSAHALADDIQRYQTSLPINARSPSTLYQLRKLVSRRRLPFALAGGLLLLTVGFAIAMSVLYARAESNLARAVQAEAATLRESETSQRVADFLTGLFAVANPSQSRGETVTARELLDAGAERIQLELSEEPAIQASLMQTMGSAYKDLGLYDSAESLLSQALESQTSAADMDAEQAVATLNLLASLRYNQGRYEDAESYARQAVNLSGDDTEFSEVLRGASLDSLSNALRSLGRYEDAESAALEAVDVLERAVGTTDEQTAAALRGLGAVYTATGRYENAARIFDREITIRRQLGGQEVGLYLALHERAEIHKHLNEYDEAEKAALESLSLGEQLLGKDHPNNGYSYNNLGSLYGRMDRFEDAERAFRRSIEIREATLAPNHPLIAWTLDNLALLLVRQNRLDEAEPLLVRALDIAEVAVGKDHPDYGIVLSNIARLRVAQGRLEEAEQLQSRQIEITRATLDPQSLKLATRLQLLVEIQRDQQKFEEAVRNQREAIAIFRLHNDEDELQPALALLGELEER